MFTDSHIHLYLEQFDTDLDFLIQEALNHKINRFLLPNIDNDTLPKLLSTCNKYPDLLFPMIGLHPCSVNKNYRNDLELLYEKLNEFYKNVEHAFSVSKSHHLVTFGVIPNEPSDRFLSSLTPQPSTGTEHRETLILFLFISIAIIVFIY